MSEANFFKSLIAIADGDRGEADVLFDQFASFANNTPKSSTASPANEAAASEPQAPAAEPAKAAGAAE